MPMQYSKPLKLWLTLFCLMKVAASSVYAEPGPSWLNPNPGLFPDGIKFSAATDGRQVWYAVRDGTPTLSGTPFTGVAQYGGHGTLAGAVGASGRPTMRELRGGTIEFKGGRFSVAGYNSGILNSGVRDPVTGVLQGGGMTPAERFGFHRAVARRNIEGGFIRGGSLGSRSATVAEFNEVFGRVTNSTESLRRSEQVSAQRSFGGRFAMGTGGALVATQLAMQIGPQVANEVRLSEIREGTYSGFLSGASPSDGILEPDGSIRLPTNERGRGSAFLAHPRVDASLAPSGYRPPRGLVLIGYSMDRMGSRLNPMFRPERQSGTWAYFFFGR